jgi:hypothetical protein
MSTAIIANPLRDISDNPPQRFGLYRRWKNFLALFPSHQRAERLSRLIAQYRTLPFEVRNNPANHEATAMIESVRNQAHKRLPCWSDLAAVERALLSLLPADDLKRSGWTLREEFRKATSTVPGDQSLLKAYEDSKPPRMETSTEAEVQSLRADLLALQGQLHELCATRRVQIRARNFIALLTVALSALAIFVTLQLDKLLGINDTIVFDVFGVGMLGGVFSTLLRIQKFKLGGNYEASALSQPGNQLSVILSPAIGGLGAVVLFVVLAAGFLKTPVFPEMPLKDFGLDSDALEALFKIHFISPADAAKLYLLCFLSGFSERLVPDVMSRLAAAAEKAK